MPATPSPNNKERLEILWSEYDAYAKLENMITFLISDLFSFEEYLKSQEGELPGNLVRQFAQDFEEFRADAKELKRVYNFSKGEEVAKEIFETVDELSHKALEKMLLARDHAHLERALHKWTQAGECTRWRKNLSFLGKAILDKMTSLEQEIAYDR